MSLGKVQLVPHMCLYKRECLTLDFHLIAQQAQIKRKPQPGSTHLRNQHSRRTVDPRFVNRHVKTIDCIFKGENMKTVILALMVLVVVSQGEALRCRCGGTSKICSSGPVETCRGFNQVCGSIVIHAGPHVSYFKSCMSADDCRQMSHSQVSSGSCCSQDLCN